MKQNEVVVFQSPDTVTSYSNSPPFDASKKYPEFEGERLSVQPNPVYESVRQCFYLAGLDKNNFGSTEWNPLTELIMPGETVLLKPNLVKESHPRDPDGWKYVLTQGSVIRAVADYVWKALQGRGKIIVADAPQTDSSFEKICQLLGLYELRDFYLSRGVNFELTDLRKEEWTSQDGVIVNRRQLEGDPRGYVAFDLSYRSEFANHPGEGRYYGADYDAGEVNRHHSCGRHEYLISGTAIYADVIFSLPKLKTHKKAGITVTLKNLVGINGDKNWLPHHTEGDPVQGGDERPVIDSKGRAERSFIPYFRWISLHLPRFGPHLHRWARRIGARFFGDTEDIIRSGNWYGNNTTWRMCLDLNKIALFGRLDGTFSESPPTVCRRHYSLVDGIIAGEGNGPMNPDPKRAGLLIFGINPASVDAACAYMMGYDPEAIPIVRQAFHCNHFPIMEGDWHHIKIISNSNELNGPLPKISDAATLHFKPHFGWKGHIERNRVR